MPPPWSSARIAGPARYRSTPASGRSWRSTTSPCSRRGCGTPCGWRRRTRSKRVCQYISLPDRNSRLTPASRALHVGALGPRSSTRRGRRTGRSCGCQQAAVPVGVDAGQVGDVVAVLLEELDRRVLVGEEEVLPARAASAGEDRPVVADLVRPAVGRATGVEVRARRRCCRPARSRRLSGRRRRSGSCRCAPRTGSGSASPLSVRVRCAM